MTKEQKRQYSEPESLKEILKRVLSGRKFMLDCGHHVSLFHNLGNDITIEFAVIFSTFELSGC